MKTVLVTGATAGIGYETTRQLLLMGLGLLIHGRDRQRAQAAVRNLEASHGPGQAVAIYGDLSAMHEVVDLVRQSRVETDVFDVLVNNAGYTRRSDVIRATDSKPRWPSITLLLICSRVDSSTA